MKHTTYILSIIACLIVACEDDSTSPQVNQVKKLTSYIDSYGTDGAFDPSSKITFEYNDQGQLIKSTYFSYNSNTGNFNQERIMILYYSAGRLDKLEATLPTSTTPYIRYDYTYFQDAKVASITEKYLNGGPTTTATFSYLSTDSLSVSYSSSNGGGFIYNVNLANGNINRDRTTKGAEVCSNGVYTYDASKNPLHELGYVDFLLLNLSVNNKVSEDVDYLACAFPELIPQSYEHQSNVDGFPEVSLTTFESNGGALRQAKREFTYSLIEVN